MNFKGIIRGALISYIFTAVILLGGAAVAYFDLIDERVAGIAVFAGAVIGVFIGALCAARRADGKKLFNALAVSVLFAAAVFAGAVWANGGAQIHTRAAVLLGSVGAAGIMGALFG